MSRVQKAPLRPLSPQEHQELQRIVKASSEMERSAILDHVRRAQALLAVAQGHSFTEAANLAGFNCPDSVAQLVARFNQRGVLSLDIGGGRGRRPTYVV